MVWAEVWRSGKLVTHCQVRIDPDRAPYVVHTDDNVADGDYEIRRGDAGYEVTCKAGQWAPRIR